MTFWAVVTLFLGVALAFTAWPLLRPTRVREADDPTRRQSVIRAVYRDRVAELEAEAEAGQIDGALRDEVVEELGASLLDDYRAAEAASAASSAAAGPTPSGGDGAGARVAPGWVLLLALPLAAILVYLSVGEPDSPRLVGAAEVLSLDPDTERDRLLMWSQRLERRVERKPEDTQSWYLLGMSRLQSGEFAGAADALARVHEDLGDQGNVTLYWLQASYLAAGGQLDEPTRHIAERVLVSQPAHPLVLEMFAIDAYRKGEYRRAVEFLNRALNNPLTAPQLASLLGGLAEARSRMGELRPSIDVEVSLPEDAPRDGTLFVIARPPGGGMPYAVVRRPAGLVPVSIRLDDTVSMSEELRLSSAAEFEVVVRLSRSGAVAAAPGDWEWHSEVLRMANLQDPVRLDAALEPPRGEG
jgi:cytochrome c-type biogenesis protein CcmH